MKRLMVRIDEELCNGCGACVPNCVEGALRIIDGKARLVSDALCDGLGACLGECPQGALTVEERDSVPFDEEAAKIHMAAQARQAAAPVASRPVEPAPVQAVHAAPAGGCPGSRMRVIERPQAAAMTDAAPAASSELVNWPVQLTLMPLRAPYLDGADLLLSADCVPFAYPNFHRDLLTGRVVAIACPKLDDAQFYVEKLATVFRDNDLRSVTIAHMEVPCCFGLGRIVHEALARAGKDLPVRDLTVKISGELEG